MTAITKNAICMLFGEIGHSPKDDSNANDNFDSWIPTTNAEIRLKEVIEKIEKRIKK